jgi:hypothetical protein
MDESWSIRGAAHLLNQLLVPGFHPAPTIGRQPILANLLILALQIHPH